MIAKYTFLLLATTSSTLYAASLKQPLSLSSKALVTVKLAEEALHSGSIEGLERGISILQQVIQDSSFKRLSIEKQLPIFLTLSKAYEQRKNFGEQEKLLTQLIANDDFKSYGTQLKVALCKCYLAAKRPLDAENIFKKLTKKSQITFPQDDRTAIAHLWEAFDTHWTTLLKEATKNFREKNYSLAIQQYGALATALDKEYFPKTTSKSIRNEHTITIKYRLAASYFFAREFKKSLPVLGKVIRRCETSGNTQLLTNCLLMQSEALFELCDFHDALASYKRFLQTASPEHLAYEMTHLRASFAALQIQELTLAEHYLEKVHSLPLRWYADLILTKIWMTKNQPEKALKLLDELSNADIIDEVLYTKGVILNSLGRFNEAATSLESVVQSQDIKSLPLFHDARTLLGTTYMQLAEQNIRERLHYFSCAEECFYELFMQERTPSTFYALVEHYFTLIYKYEQTEKISNLEILLRTYLKDFPEKEQIIGKLVLAKITLHSQEKAAIFNSLDSNLARYIEALESLQEPDAMLKTLQAVHDLEKQNLVKTLYLHIPHKDAYEKALLLALQSSHDDEESLFLQIHAYAHTDPTHVKKLAKEFLEKLPNSTYCPAILHLLGSLALQNHEESDAFDYFTTVLKDHPAYQKRDEIYFLAAYAIEKKDFEKARTLRKELISNCPASSFAAEAFFRVFPESEYIAATPHAIRHLEELIANYPKALFTVPACYYVGKYYTSKQPKLAADCFCKAEKILETLSIPPPLHTYLQTMTTQLLLLHGRTGDVSAKDPLIKLLMQTKNDLEQRTLYQEASFLLAKVFAALNKPQLCRKQLMAVIQWHIRNKVTGEFFARSYLELGKLEDQGKRYTKAMNYFDKALTLVTFGPTDLPLEIKIAKSITARKMGKLDQAMTCLSQVINDDIASQLRIHAMLLRAEIYELQHRNDLAIKQLISASQKGGEWGLEAKRKLEESYGYQ